MREIEEEGGGGRPPRAERQVANFLSLHLSFTRPSSSLSFAHVTCIYTYVVVVEAAAAAERNSPIAPKSAKAILTIFARFLANVLPAALNTSPLGNKKSDSIAAAAAEAEANVDSRCYGRLQTD